MSDKQDKLTVIRTMGCTAYGLTVNDEYEADLTDDVREQVIDKLVERYRQELLDKKVDIIEAIGQIESDDYESDDKPCDQCGDTVSTETWYL